MPVILYCVWERCRIYVTPDALSQGPIFWLT